PITASPSRWLTRSVSSSIARPSAASCRPRPTGARPPDAAQALAAHRPGGGGGGGLDLLSLSAAEDDQPRSRPPGRHPPRAGRRHRQGAPDPDGPDGGARALEPRGEGPRRAKGGAPGQHRDPGAARLAAGVVGGAVAPPEGISLVRGQGAGSER